MFSQPFNRKFGFLFMLGAVVILLGLSSSVAGRTVSAAVPPTPGTPTPDQAQIYSAWHTTMGSIPLPGRGCFTATYPSTQWQSVKCVTAPSYPMVPRHGAPPPGIVGNGDDVSAVAPSGTISKATGSFSNVSGVTSEAGQVNATGGQVANAYTFQLNTNFFYGTPACAGAYDSSCQGWEQYIFENDVTDGVGFVFIQYWLINYNNPCPTANPPWYSYSGSCYKNSYNSVSTPTEAITKLQALSLTGTAASGSDGVSFADNGTVYATTGDNAVYASGGWTAAEYNIVGDGGGGQANFNNGASMATNISLTYGGTSAPTCAVEGFTGETNNLNFGPSAPASATYGPALAFTQSTAGGAASECAAAVEVGASTPVVDSIGIYRAGKFYLRLHNSTGIADYTVAYSAGTKPYPIVGDWAGAGFDTIGVYDQATGFFYLRNSNTAGGIDESVLLGNPNDTPLSGRWQSTATHAGVGVFRPTNGILYMKNALTSGYSDYSDVLGNPGDVGVAGDWTGKGFDSPGVYRPGATKFFLSNQVTNGIVYGDIYFNYGASTDLPIMGDWVAQGHDGVGMFRPSSGYVLLKNALTTGAPNTSFNYGASGDVPVAGHWQLTYPPIAPQPTTEPTSAPNNGSGGSVPGGNQIGG